MGMPIFLASAASSLVSEPAQSPTRRRSGIDNPENSASVVNSHLAEYDVMAKASSFDSDNGGDFKSPLACRVNVAMDILLSPNDFAHPMRDLLGSKSLRKNDVCPPGPHPMASMCASMNARTSPPVMPWRGIRHSYGALVPSVGALEAEQRPCIPDGVMASIVEF